MARARSRRLAVSLAGLTFLAACEPGQEFNLFGPPAMEEATGNNGAPGSNRAGSGAVVMQDVEAPEVFQATETGLWDGRPSLGGVWIAHPDVTDPQRVLIRNEDNGNFIIGALFRRERNNPGPRFQVSSDAASELGMLAGAPSNLSVVALRSEEVAVEPAVSDPTEEMIGTALTIENNENIQARPLDPVAAIAASAIEAATAADAQTQETPHVEPDAAPAPAATPAPAPAPVSSLRKPFVQIGIFSMESNAENTSDLLRGAGIIPTIKVSQSSGKTYWRVIVGPLGNTADRSQVIKTVQGLGFADAYAVSN